MNKTKLRIGEFSQLMQVTVKTLRFYEQKGLLLPDEVDEWTGYRYYSIGQMQQLANIRNLQRLGFSLDEIKELFEENSHTPSIKKLSEKIKETEKELRLLIARRDRLLNWRDSRKEIKTMEKFSIQSLPEIIVASHREVIASYEALGPLCVEKIGPEMQRLGCKCPTPGYFSLLNTTRSTNLPTSTSSIASRWKRWGQTVASSSSRNCQPSLRHFAWSMLVRTTASTNLSQRHSDIWKNKIWRLQEHHVPAILMEYGIKRTQKSGCPWYRFL